MELSKNSLLLIGFQAVYEAIAAGKTIEKLWIKNDLASEHWKNLKPLLQEHQIRWQAVPIEKLNQLTRKASHQGIVALISQITYVSFEDTIQNLLEAKKNPFIALLDGITDVRNVGAIARTCLGLGVDLLVLPQQYAVTITSDAIKTSSGALLHLPIARVSHILDAVYYLKQTGIQVVAISEKGKNQYFDQSYTVPTAIILGSEEKGISGRVLAESNLVVKIPMNHKIASLNVSVAAGIIIAEISRQRITIQSEF
ncbi:MAG: 23S rRNA (guanosine(2251)-2'-O)-methyltransferase RlmB [Bacteroidia bacterium]|nr:23S rRNA (guanosine(2251)-2'-O)-methyltransferase RlmB [Bacteroidia bacterium]